MYYYEIENDAATGSEYRIYPYRTYLETDIDFSPMNDFEFFGIKISHLYNIWCKEAKVCEDYFNRAIAERAKSVVKEKSWRNMVSIGHDPWGNHELCLWLSNTSLNLYTLLNAKEFPLDKTNLTKYSILGNRFVSQRPTEIDSYFFSSEAFTNSILESLKWRNKYEYYLVITTKSDEFYGLATVDNFDRRKEDVKKFIADFKNKGYDVELVSSDDSEALDAIETAVQDFIKNNRKANHKKFNICFKYDSDSRYLSRRRPYVMNHPDYYKDTDTHFYNIINKQLPNLNDLNFEYPSLESFNKN